MCEMVFTLPLLIAIFPDLVPNIQIPIQRSPPMTQYLQIEHVHYATRICFENFFNFGENFINWITVLFNTCIMEPSVMINGRLSAWLYLQRGCRQGDPLSPYLFIQDPEIQAFSQKVVIKILIIVIEVFF